MIVMGSGVDCRMGRWGQGNPAHPVGGPGSPVPAGPSVPAGPPDDEIRELLAYPDEIGRRVGFKDLTKMHREWMLNMIRGEGDYTLQAHRGSYKSSCLAVAISLMLVLYAKKNIIFLRKTDNDVSEMLGIVMIILASMTLLLKLIEVIKDLIQK